MKILLVTHIYPPAVDGGSRVIAKIGDYLQSQGHQIEVLTTDCHSSDDFSRFYSSDLRSKPHLFRLPVITVFHRPLKLATKIFPDLGVFSKGPIFKIIPFLKSVSAVKNFHPNLIIAGPLPTAIVLYAGILKKITGAKLLINASFHPTDPDFSREPLINALKNADFIWTLTDFETGYFRQNFHIPSSKMILAGNGVNKSLLIKNFKLKIKNSNNLLFVGSFAAHKGIATLIDAFCCLPPAVTLTLAGKKTLYFPAVNHKIQTLPPSIQKRIKFLYDFSDSQLAGIIDDCTILISPSTQESFGLVLLEAWARGKPVIAADIPASAELITKTNGGLTFKINDPSDLARKIRYLLKNPKFQKELGQNGFQYVQNHLTWDKIGKTLWSKISSSLSSSPS